MARCRIYVAATKDAVALFMGLSAELERLARGYLWQRQPLVLEPARTIAGGARWRVICGCVRYGDCIDDEWAAVHLLRLLSARFPDVVAISVEDCDGEILLIECADVLPKWIATAQPPLVNNRTFLRRGELHVIPLADSPALLPLLPPHLTIDKALSVLQCPHPGVATLAPEPMRVALARRLARFEGIRSGCCLGQALHHANMFVPVAVAAALATDRQLVAPAVAAYFYKDSGDDKAVDAAEETRPFDSRRERCVYCRVAFPRCLYAQLAQQQPVPAAAEAKAAELGARLARGFAIAYHNTTTDCCGEFDLLTAKLGVHSFEDAQCKVVCAFADGAGINIHDEVTVTAMKKAHVLSSDPSLRDPGYGAFKCIVNHILAAGVTADHFASELGALPPDDMSAPLDVTR
eukprot:TRINITY_DN1709_c0_g1_i8.p1 TRINITY_DN1709_c0_g1~~TRINITY_DN1709_c0_g1_i8.p1  ORF type:complete len:417 (-),score=87.61 TRINITY_DN1709_c0_g1_i8:519-1736(-)